MGSDFFADIIGPLSRAHFGFWLHDRRNRIHTVPAKLIIAVLFLIVAFMTLTLQGSTAVASAIYTVYSLAILCFALFICFARNLRVTPRQVSVIVEAYVVALFITMLLLFHNLIFPIEYFAIDAGVDRGSWVQLKIACIYSLPAALYLGIQTWQVAKDRIRAARRYKPSDRRSSQVQAIIWRFQREAIAWSLLHYVVISILIWALLFVQNDRMNLINNAVKQIKLM